MIETAAKDNNTFLIKMSNTTGEGVADVKGQSCEILLEYRLSNKTKGKNEKVMESILNRIYVAQPKSRDEKTRPALIPAEVIEERRLNPLPEDQLERKITNNRIKDLMEQKGGDGVFYIPDREHFILAKPEWKDDIMPEIMDGKNIFDFVDPDILEKLQRLEQDEEQFLIERQQNRENMNLDEDEDDDSDDDNSLESQGIDDELLDLHQEVMGNKKEIRKRHELVKRSTLPRKVRDLTETEAFMQKLRVDRHEAISTAKELGTKKTKKRAEKVSAMQQIREEEQRKKAKIEADESEEEDEFDVADEDMMDVDDMDEKKLSKAQQSRLRADRKIKRKNEAHNKTITERMKRKIQSRFSQRCIVNDADRRIGAKLPKHLNTGVRGIGKTDRR